MERKDKYRADVYVRKRKASQEGIFCKSEKLLKGGVPIQGNIFTLQNGLGSPVPKQNLGVGAK